MLDPRPDSVVGLDRNLAQAQAGHPGPKDLQTRVDDRPPATKLPELRGVRAGAHNPSAAVVGRVPLPHHTGVHPDDIAMAQEPVSRDGRVGQITVQRPWSQLPTWGHHLPDRVDPARRRTKFEHPAKKHRTQIGLPDTRSQQAQRVDHRKLVEPLRLANTRHLVDGFHQLGRAQDRGRIHPINA